MPKLNWCACLLLVPALVMAASLSANADAPDAASPAVDGDSVSVQAGSDGGGGADASGAFQYSPDGVAQPRSIRGTRRKSQAQIDHEYNVSTRAAFVAQSQARDAAGAAYGSNVRAGKCAVGAELAGSAACTAPAKVAVPNYRPEALVVAGQPQQGGAAPPAPPVLTPQQAAEIAVARLTVPTVKPGIGPPPEINKWKMAVVGYPLWLYANGETQIGPVTDTVGAQSVSLDASLSSVTYEMGDGGSKMCTGTGTVWTPAVTPGLASPDCGYVYQKASLPSGDYTVTAKATWSVTWQINDQTGVLPITTTSTRQLPVGELQAVIVHR